MNNKDKKIQKLLRLWKQAEEEAEMYSDFSRWEARDGDLVASEAYNDRALEALETIDRCQRALKALGYQLEEDER